MKDLKKDIERIHRRVMLRKLFEWFTDPDNGGIRRFYVILGIVFFGFFFYTNNYRIKNYDVLNKERIELIQKENKLIEKNAILKTENEILKEEREIIDKRLENLVQQLNDNVELDEKEKQIIADMSTRDKLDYLAGTRNLYSTSDSLSDTGTTR